MAACHTGRAAIAVSHSGQELDTKARRGLLSLFPLVSGSRGPGIYLFFASSGAIPTNSGSMRMRPQYSHTMTFLCILISIWR